MSLFEPLHQNEDFKLLAARALGADKEPVLVSGLTEEARLYWMAGLQEASPSQMLVIMPNELKIREVCQNLEFYLNTGLDEEKQYRILPFFPKDTLFYQADLSSLSILAERSCVLKTLTENNRKTVVVTSAVAMFDPLMPPEEWAERIIKIRIGQEISIDTLRQRLFDLGYECVEMVETPAQFAVRGGIVDIVTPNESLRVEFWGDEIDSIRTLNLDTQRSEERLADITLYPVSEIVPNGKRRAEGLRRLNKEAEKQAVSFEKEAETKENAARIRQIIGRVKERVEEGNVRGLDVYYPAFFETAFTLADYLDKDAVLCLWDAARIAEKARVFEEENRQMLTGRLNQGYIVPVQTSLFPPKESLYANLADFRRVTFAAIASSNQEVFPIKRLLNVQSLTISGITHDYNLMVDELKSNQQMGYQTLMLTTTPEALPDLERRLSEEGLSIYQNEKNQPLFPPRGKIALSLGAIDKGWRLTEQKLCLIPFHENVAAPGSKKAQKHRKPTKPEDFFRDLKVGDYVVHENHGIALYQGVVQMEDKFAAEKNDFGLTEGEAQTATRDYFKLLYRDGGVLYVPTTSLDMLQKYVAGEDAAPKLSRLGTQDWSRTKQKVRESVKELAFGLVHLYALRRSKEGFSFSEDTVWQKEFEDQFPYEETGDQLTAIEETKKDMESPHIMDRLICGDVGYGKTEVAIRAAFKAVQDGKQVALLAPTTILAQQHFNTFTNRMKEYPVTIALLSRFQTPREMEKTVNDIEKGRVDIVIGTHRLLSKDVRFKDLGLLVVDEEQRFGVGHKETIKNIKEDVDVLTLTATPIPRTLHMSLSGMRDMSLLSEAPQDRRPIQTFVMEEDKTLVREAIYRELSRQGQVYFLHNRVNNIDDTLAEVQEMVPEARVAVAHGQMSERELEKVMMRFVEGEIDVLVCTTIVETGLDIPNVNTIIIQNADAMGLAQLYQLRGRVGRSDRSAYAYLLYRKGKVLTELAESRLAAISEYTEFGSGFKIAVRDLELRGAGNVLGPEQHGHMGAVGYELYCKLLDEEISKLSGKTPKFSFETTIRLAVEAFIPPKYIESEPQKLSAYKKIATIQDQDDLMDITDEFIDRYGDMPEEVRNLLQIAYIKALGQKLGADRIEQEGEYVTLHLRSDSKISVDKLFRFAEAQKLVNGKAPLRLVTRSDELRVKILTFKEKPLVPLQKTLESMQDLIATEEK